MSKLHYGPNITFRISLSVYTPPDSLFMVIILVSYKRESTWLYISIRTPVTLLSLKTFY